MKGFGPLNPHFEQFLQKLNTLGLQAKLDRKMQENLKILEDIYVRK
ncbi:MAG: hypothetical protein ACFFG0_33775 [Candidatus Thorarchaeota archaeon]